MPTTDDHLPTIRGARTARITLETGATVRKATLDFDRMEGIVLAEWAGRFEFVVWHVYNRPEDGDVWQAEIGDYFRFTDETKLDAHEKALRRYRERAARV